MPLKTAIKKTEDKLELTLVGDNKALEPILRQVYNRLRPSVTVAGFRPGRAPDSAIEKQLGAERIQTEVVEAAASNWYSTALKEHNATPLTQPHIEVIKFVPYQDLQLRIQVEIMPEIKLVDYTKLKVKPEPTVINKKEIDDVIKGLQLRSATRKAVQRAAKKGDEVVIDFNGSQAGKPVEGAKGIDYPLQLGSNRFIPGFEEALIGLKAGAKKNFDITFPKDYQVASLQGQKVNFDVTLKTVNEMVLPELNDKFAASMGPFKDTAGLQTSVKEQLEHAKTDENRRKFENQVVKEVVEKSQLKLPQNLISNELDALKSEFESSLKSQGQNLEQYLKVQGKTQKQWEEELAKEASLRIKTALVLTEIAKKEEVMVTNEEQTQYLQILREQYKDKTAQEQLDKPEVQRDLRNRMLTEKTIQKLVSYVK
jgi:trigger factor